MVHNGLHSTWRPAALTKTPTHFKQMQKWTTNLRIPSQAEMFIHGLILETIEEAGIGKHREAGKLSENSAKSVPNPLQSAPILSSRHCSISPPSRVITTTKASWWLLVSKVLPTRTSFPPPSSHSTGRISAAPSAIFRLLRRSFFHCLQPFFAHPMKL